MDQKALTILERAYWSSAGWIPEEHRAVAPEDFEYAKRAGMMFDPIQTSHNLLVRRALAAREAVTKQAVVDAFLASLSTRRLAVRSALGSFSVLRHMPRHSFSAKNQYCPVCGWYENRDYLHDLSVLNFERHKWGGVRHDGLLYATFDLELFRATNWSPPKEDDRRILGQIVATIRCMGPNDTVPELVRALGKVLKSNKAERESVIDILGLCGILETDSHRGYFGHFVRWDGRELPSRRFVDRAYPVCWWRGADGISEAALRSLFGDATHA
jgi:hypothetical protein